MNTSLHVLSQQACVLGESPVWHADEKVLYWVDIVGKTVHRLNQKTQRHHSWLMPTEICCIAPNKNGGLIAALKNGVALLNPISNDINYFVELNISETMFNDGHCDNHGRFWLGTKNNAENKSLAGIFCLYKNKLIQKADNFIVANGLVFSLDSKYFYIADSPKRIIYRYDFNANNGEINNQTIFARIPDDAGYPDGMTIDSEGYLWNCHYNGWRITRYSPDGKVDCVIKVPTQAPTSCCFGGDDLKTLFITTAKRDVKEADLKDQPFAGCLFAMDVDVSGVLDNQYQ